MIRLSMIGPIVASLGSSPIPPLLSSALEEKITISKVLETWNAHLNFSKSFGVANSVFIPFTEIKIVSRRIRNLHPPIFSRLLEFSWMLSMAFVRVTSLEEEEESAFELLSSFSEQQKGCYQQQCVTIPKIWTKPNPKLFSDTKFIRYRIRYFFRYQIFTIPNPILFTIPNFFDTESETI